MICVHPAKMAEHPDAKRAQTDYFTLWFLGNRLSWMALEPVTGRTHQLRAHMAEIGHPILGDGKYGGRRDRERGRWLGCRRRAAICRSKLHLHARSLTIEHPITKEMMTFTAPLPEHMARTWKLLDWKENDVPADPFEAIRMSAWSARSASGPTAEAVPVDGGFTVHAGRPPGEDPGRRRRWCCRRWRWPRPSRPNGMRRRARSNPETMPFTRTANSAHRQGGAAVRRGGGRCWPPMAAPTFCATAPTGPHELVARQAAGLGPAAGLGRADAWARRWCVTAGRRAMSRKPADSLAALARARSRELTPFQLAGVPRSCRDLRLAGAGAGGDARAG